MHRRCGCGDRVHLTAAVVAAANAGDAAGKPGIVLVWQNPLPLAAAVVSRCCCFYLAGAVVSLAAAQYRM